MFFCHCSFGARTKIFEPPDNHLGVVDVYDSINRCYRLRKRLGFVCGLGAARQEFKEQSAARQDHLEEKILERRRHGVNCFLRLVWMLPVLQVAQRCGWNGNAFSMSTAGLEIFRRGIWKVFGIENEHLNCVGKYRAIKAVPLPFNGE